MNRNFKTTDIYDNCRIFTKEDQFLSYASRKRIDWYLNKGIAEKINENDIRLLFQTQKSIDKMEGVDDPYYCQPRKNQCVVCGLEEKLTRHHIVPWCVKRFFPMEKKEFTSHDVLPLCIGCHDLYEIKADELKQQYAKQYNHPLNGILPEEENKYLKCLRARGFAGTLLKHGNLIPENRRQTILNQIKDTLQLNSIEEINLEEISNLTFVPTVITLGQKIFENAGSIEEIVQTWREHFITTMKPKFLPEYW